MKMKPFKGLIFLEEAMTQVLSNLLPIEDLESVPLDQASGRVLAQPVEAELDIPGFDRSAG